MKQILVEGGYIEGGAYDFYLTDHLGNNRVVANASGNPVQTNHFYPFGMSFSEGTVISSQPYKYNGKELDTERGLNLYDYSARYMDPVVGRFTTVDPNVENYYSDSPYSYCLNNPINFTDPFGADTIAVNNVNWEKFNSEEDVISLDEVTTVAPSNLIGTRASEPISGVWGYIGYYLLDRGANYYSPSTNFTYRVGTDGVIAGVAPMGGIAPLPSTTPLNIKDIAKLLKAGKILSKAGLTSVGRALKKHGDRTGSVFPKAMGNPAAINVQGEKILKEILEHPNVKVSIVKSRSVGEALDYAIPGGRGARFSSDGTKSIGFLEPKL